MQSLKFKILNELELPAVAKKISQHIRIGDILCLNGPLGAGKTTFTRCVVEAMGGDFSQVSSPTFSIVQEYICRDFVIQHADFYRLPQNTELEDLGGLEFFDPEKITIVEWSERSSLITLINPKRLARLDFQVISEARILEFSREI